MSIGFFSTLAGENADAARSWRAYGEEQYERAEGWQNKAIRLENELQDVHHSWKKHSDELKNKIIEWQRSAIQGEAISRAKTAVIEEVTNGKAPIDIAGEEKYLRIVEEKKQEVMKQWGVNPWADQ